MATLYYRPYTTELQNDDESNMSAISNRDGLLPEYQYIFDPDIDDKESISTESEIQPDMNDDLYNDLSRYKLAMRRMSTEIINLREQMKNLTHRNTQLHCNHCDNHKETAVLIGEVIDLNSISKEELLDKYIMLNSNYEETSMNLQTYKEKVHKLQIELIKKNDREVELLKISKAHSSQNVLIQNLQRRVHKIKLLEDTIKEQELIISKMEKQIEKNNKKGHLAPIMEVSSAREKDLNIALHEENNRLRHEIDTVKNNQPKLKNINIMSDSERLELYQLLDKAEQRIMALEKQISGNQRDWQREKKRSPELDEYGLSKIKF